MLPSPNVIEPLPSRSTLKVALVWPVLVCLMTPLIPSGERAAATVERLDGEGVVEEIRRMLGGESTDEAADKHARELLKAA